MFTFLSLQAWFVLRDLLKTKSGTELWLQVRKQRNANLAHPQGVTNNKMTDCVS